MTKIHNRCVTVTHLEYKSNSNHTGATPVALLINHYLGWDVKMMLRKLMLLLEILMPLFAMIETFVLLCKVLMQIYCKIYDRNFYEFDYVNNIEWTSIIVVTIFFMPATSRAISIILLALAIVNNIIFLSYYKKADKYKDDSKFDKISLIFTTCLFCCTMIIVILVK